MLDGLHIFAYREERICKKRSAAGMTEYHRRIAYIDLYQGSEKIKNAGFAKIEQRGKQCKMQFTLKTPPDLDGREASVYLLKEAEQAMTGIKVGTVRFAASAGNYAAALDGENVENTGLTLSEMCGIYIADQKEKQYHFQSQWNGTAFDKERFIPLEEWKRQEQSQSTVEPEMNEQKESIADTGQLEAESRNHELESEEAYKETETKIIEPAAPEMIQRDEPEALERKGEPESARQPGTTSRSLWEQIGSRYTKVSGRMLRENCECIKLTPADLRCLPRCYWQLSKNSFLLHGYYQYRYVVLLRYQDRERYRNYIGVPGTKDGQQKKMAEMFGFSDFMEVAEQSLSSPNRTAFGGYWCMELPRLENLS